MLRTLHDHWTLRPVAGPVPPAIVAAGAIPATVPGTVHTDLLAAGLIPDPYLDDHERQLGWIGVTDWRYQTTFDWTAGEPDECVELTFDGLDTIADVELNGHRIARTANMHRSYRIDVRDHLVPGTNALAVTFASAVRHADQASLDLGARPHVNHHPYNAIRKMACNFGWDWGPDLVTAGIWRPVTLRSWRTARLVTVRPVVTVVGTVGTVTVHMELARSGDGPDLTVSATIGDVEASATIEPGQTATTVTAAVDDVQRWWPRGYGEAHLYDLTVRLGEGSSAALDQWHGRVGFRTVVLDTRPDEQGTPASFVVNDVPVFVKGANWIPDDAFPHRVTPSRYAQRLSQAAEAGVNLLRVWGGGIYEDDAFYAECDRRGLMTWQDFLFACAAYSEEEPLRSEVIAEARENVVRLMPHPSLVLWNGNNENVWGYADWGWDVRLDGKSWGGGYYDEVLPAIVAELDPGRPYSAGSPSSFGPGHHPNDAAHGTMHIWDVWNQLDYTRYRSHRPRFVAEFGWQGPPTWATLRRAISDDPLTPESPGMLAHQKAAEGNFKLTGGLIPHLPLPSTMDDWHWAMSLNQARAVRTGIEYFRSLSPYCTGSVMWQLNDCWPAISWSAIDGDGRRKPLFYALRAAHADRLLTVQPDGDELRVVIINDTPKPWQGLLQLSRMSYAGAIAIAAEIAVDVTERSTLTVTVPAALATPDRPGDEFLLAQLDRDRTLWTFVENRDAALPVPSIQADAVATDGGYLVTVTALAFLLDCALLVDKVDPDAVVEDMLVTLLPGESVTWKVDSDVRFDPARLLDPSVLRSANQLVRSGVVASPPA
jgi:beta-mannosidase